MPVPQSLIASTDRGLYCAAADVYIDAWKPVDRSIITHAHSDHARIGSNRYLCASDGVHVLRERLRNASIDPVEYGQPLSLNGVNISLHPAGHVLGSAQIRVEHHGEVWVITGDYKRDLDVTCRPFEVVPCHTLITECTFGLPIYHWRKPAEIANEINDWWRDNQRLDRTSILLGYSLGKAQRLLSMLDPSTGPILVHGAIVGMIEAYRASGVQLPAVEHASVENAKKHKGKALVLAPPSAAASTWARKFAPFSLANASGWMQIRGFRRRGGVDRGFVLSDHVDWDALLRTINETGAKRIIATHGSTGPLVRWLNEHGYEASELHTPFGDDESAPEEQVDA